MGSRPPTQRRVSTAAILVLLGHLLVVACKTGPDLSADYGQTARENFELALGEFQDGDWDEAKTYADFVRLRFPFSRYAIEAELLVARAEFEAGNYVIAQDAFKQFGRLHPTHKHTQNGWAAYMTAVSAFMNAPEGIAIMPPYYQRDQSQLREAMTELGYFFDHYPGSVMEPLAINLRAEINRRMLQHELYVARFYLDRDRPEAAIGRLENAHKDFAGLGLDAEVLFLLGLTYLKMDEIELARATFAELQAQHPTHFHGKQARLYLKYMYDSFGAADPSRARPDRSRPKPAPLPRPRNPKDPTKPGAAAPPEDPAAPPAGPPTPAPQAAPVPQTTPAPATPVTQTR
jgi:outer membrane assembly lipoprotein YfiO